MSSLRDELHLYLQQQKDAGLEFYFDPGTHVIPDSVRSQTPEPVPDTAPQPVKKAPPLNPREEAFQNMCNEFVSRTLACIAEDQSSQQQSGLFDSREEPEPASLEERQDALAVVRAEVEVCTGCKLHSSRTNTVFGTGRADSGIVFIGEAPGKNEDLEGEPFVGRSGKLLTSILKAIDFEREDVFICNILKCRPPNNRDPERDEKVACEHFLKRQIDILQPRVICCLGRQAAQTLLETSKPLKDLRETVHFYNGVPVMATFHPAALLRNPNWKRPAWDDVRKLRALYEALQPR